MHIPHTQIWTFYTDTYIWPVPFLIDGLGDIPYLFSTDDGRPLITQINERYRGGWDPLPGFTLIDGSSLKYPGDPLMNPFASLDVRDETLYVYPGAWVCVLRADRTFEVARLD